MQGLWCTLTAVCVWREGRVCAHGRERSTKAVTDAQSAPRCGPPASGEQPLCTEFRKAQNQKKETQEGARNGKGGRAVERVQIRNPLRRHTWKRSSRRRGAGEEEVARLRWSKCLWCAIDEGNVLTLSLSSFF